MNKVLQNNAVLTHFARDPQPGPQLRTPGGPRTSLFENHGPTQTEQIPRRRFANYALWSLKPHMEDFQRRQLGMARCDTCHALVLGGEK